MHSTLVRAQNVFGFFTTVAFAVAALVAFSDSISPRAPSANISVGNVQVVRGRPHYYSTKKEEYAQIKFSMNADLSSLFTWNTKQVFVYVTASWPAPASAKSTSPKVGDVEAATAVNEAVIWDTIITAPSSDHLSNIGAASLRKLIKSAKGKSIDPSRGLLKLKSQKSKYQITSPLGKLANTQNVTLSIHYNVQPWVGILTWRPKTVEFGSWKLMDGGVSEAFEFPAIKEKKVESKSGSAGTGR